MFFPKTHIDLEVDDADVSTTFYQALLGGPPSRTAPGTAIFELESPPLVLTLKPPTPVTMRKRARSSRAPRPSKDGHLLFASRHRFALVVTEPGHVGDAAVALRRAGVRLRVEDQGIEAHDPDGNTWRVRFVPFARGRAVFAI